MTPNVQVLPDAAALAQAAVQLIADRAAAAGGRFSLVLSGGSTPRAIYQLLAQPPLRERIPWQNIHLFWGDERSVPPDHPDSNYRMAREALLDQIAIPAENVHRIHAELPPAEAADAYETDLHGYFGDALLPRFDLVLLGLGEDGHTASLFPGTTALADVVRWVVANQVPQLHTERITLTLPALNNAVEVVFLVAGAAKQQAVGHALFGPHEADIVPAGLIAPTNGQLTWLLDQAAMPTINH